MTHKSGAHATQPDRAERIGQLAVHFVANLQRTERDGFLVAGPFYTRFPELRVEMDFKAKSPEFDMTNHLRGKLGSLSDIQLEGLQMELEVALSLYNPL